MMIISIIGSWDVKTAEAFIKDYKAYANGLCHDNWAHFVYFDDWTLAVPEVEPLIHEMLQWAIMRNMTHSVRIYKKNTLKDYQLQRMIGQQPEDHINRNFSSAAEGFEFLAENGFTVGQASIVA
ncbi:hypothetical protein [Agarivorans sp. 1_MG-2023]|uniref:hypothetical protein n=1 Tax=unclassified Agarivorans TaxID=2636026 RepID=UPI0026E1EEEA|nr:hypothetical protein [Agarivorans sp. 1_MG-2023]MDO6764889.1 hypothetical protein [Agarivorans sp. 1_MG-2023]